MSETNTVPGSSGVYLGRRKIYLSTEDINRENIVEILNTLLPLQSENMLEED